MLLWFQAPLGSTSLWIFSFFFVETFCILNTMRDSHAILPFYSQICTVYHIDTLAPVASQHCPRPALERTPCFTSSFTYIVRRIYWALERFLYAFSWSLDWQGVSNRRKCPDFDGVWYVLHILLCRHSRSGEDSYACGIGRFCRSQRLQLLLAN